VGKATNIPDKLGNAELGEDEEGFSYTVHVYKYKRDDKSLTIYIDTEKSKVTAIGEDDLTVFTSVGIMRK
jgi:hypothetical protein